MLTSSRVFSAAFVLLVLWNLLLFQWFASQVNDIRKDISELHAEVAFERVARLRRDGADTLPLKLPTTSSSSMVVSSTTPVLNPKFNSKVVNAAPLTTKPPQTTTTTTTLPPPPPPPPKEEYLLPIVVFCYNRAHYLKQALDTLFARRTKPHLHPVVVSQDGDAADVAAMAKSFPIEHLFQRTQRTLPDQMDFPHFAVYYHIAIHYGIGLRRTFETYPNAAGVIILEEDISIAPDMLSYFRATLPFLLNDTQLLAVSAFNDNGAVERHQPNATMLHRSDFFPGLGWLMTRKLWNEFGPKWPVSFWDDWIRNPDQRRGRHFIRPELSRTHTFGERGASGGQFYKQHLEGNTMNEQDFDWESRDLSYLNREQYDAYLDNLLRTARVLNGVPPDWSQHANSTVLFTYSTHQEFKHLAEQLMIMSDEKAGIERTAYRGVVLVRLEGNVLVLVATHDVAGRVRTR